MKFVQAYIITVLALLMCACAKSTSNRPVVVVSIPPQKYLVEQIAGERLEVKSLLEPGSNPESYEPGVSAMRSLENALVYIPVGTLAFEQNLAAKIAANRPDLPVAPASKGVEMLYGTHGQCSHHHEHEHEHDHGQPDPHIWSSVQLTRQMARNILEALQQADPEGAPAYEANFNRLDARLDSLHRRVAHRLDSANVKAFAIWHPSLSYFARDYSLNQIAVGQESKESSVKDLKQTIDKVRDSGVKVFLFQREFDSRQAKTVNRQLGTRLVVINPMNENWETEITQLTDALVD